LTSLTRSISPSEAAAINHEAASASLAAPASLGANRLNGIDFARLIAGLAIVFHHAPRSDGFIKDISMVGRFSTPLFSLLAAFFLVRHVRMNRTEGMAFYLESRLTRLLVPFVAWSGIYLIAREANRLVFQKQSDLFWIFDLCRSLRAEPSFSTFFSAMSANSGWSLFWAGTSYQLWFLPFLFTMSMLALPILFVTIGHRRRELFLATVLVATGLFMTFTFDKPYIPAWLRFFDTQTFLGLLYYRSPSFFWGLALGLLCRSGRPPEMNRRAAAWVAGAAAVFLMLFVIVFRQERLESNDGMVEPSEAILFVRLAAACILFVAFANWKSPLINRISVLGTYGYGIYLSHVLVIECLHSFRRSQRIEPAWWADLLIFAAAFAGSLAIAWLLRRNRWTSWLIP